MKLYKIRRPTGEKITVQHRNMAKATIVTNIPVSALSRLTPPGSMPSVIGTTGHTRSATTKAIMQ
jgi:hypothetical protein